MLIDATPPSLHTITIASKQIAAAALSLAERFEYPASARRPTSPSILAQLRKSPELVALAHRLYPQAQSHESLFFDIDPECLDPWPRWANGLEALLSALTTTGTSKHDCPDPTAMFADVFAPLLKIAEAGLIIEQRSEADIAVILKSAHSYLQQRLLQLSGRVLATFFNQFKDKNTAQTHPDDAFIDWLRCTGFMELLQQHPVLARLWLTEVRSWQCTVQRFLKHFSQDRDAIASHFKQPPSALVSMRMGLSDPHQEGRTVCCLTFESGFKLAYKPRPMAIEAAYTSFMRSFDQRLASSGESILLGAHALDILDRHDHGWVVWIEPAPCHSEQALARYFHRFGQTIALNQLLGIGDIHPENLIAQNQFPIQVDIEVALRAPLKNELLPTSNGCTEALLDSIIFTNMVPLWVESAPGTAQDASGWVRATGETAQETHHAWSLSATGHLTLKLESQPVHPQHLPRLDGIAISPVNHLSHILTGMASIHQALAEDRLNRTQLAADMAEHFTGVPVRFVFRDTSQYLKLLERLTSPSCHRSGLIRSVAIALLASPLNHLKNESSSALLRGLITSECAALEANEVPYFEGCTDSTEIVARGQSIEGLFATSGLAHSQNRVLAWSEASTRRQADLLLTACLGRFDKTTSNTPTLICKPQRRDIKATSSATDILIAESTRIENLLFSTALFSEDGRCNWIGTEPVGSTERLQFRTLEAGLYEGLAGIAMVLSMRLQNIPKPSNTYTLLHGVLLSIERQLQESTNTTGWGMGLGGIAYALAYIHTSTGNVLAKKILNQLPDVVPPLPEDVTTNNYDLLEGAAGLIAGFSAAWQYTHSPWLLALAQQWAHHLLERFTAVTAILAKSHGASLAHGTDGLRVALARLARALRDHGEASGALRYELLVTHLTANQNIVTARRGEGSWCHGHAGWLATRHHTQTSLRTELSNFVGQPPAHLCCGELGRIDALLATQHSQIDVERLTARMAELIRSAASAGAYPFYLQAPESLLPGLFTGVTGVAYLCERLRQVRLGQPSPCITGIV